MDKHAKIAIIGCGNMGEAFLKILKESNFTNIWISTKSETRLQELKLKYQVNGSLKNDELKDAKLIFLAVKPQSLKEIDFTDQTNQTIVSMLAATTTKDLETKFSKAKIVRIMPNMGMLANEGITAVFWNKLKDTKTIKFILEKAGMIVELEDENDFPTFTALAGCGPGFIYYFTECLAEVGKKMGISKKASEMMANKVLIGAAASLKKENLTAQQMKEKVASKGGLTEAGLKSFEKNNLLKVCTEALNASFKKEIS